MPKIWDIPNVAKNDTFYVTTDVQWDIPYGRFSVSQNCIPPYRVIVDLLYLSFANPTENVVLGLRFLDFLIKVRKNMIFFVFMISTLKSLEIDSPFEMIEFRDVFAVTFCLK